MGLLRVRGGPLGFHGPRPWDPRIASVTRIHGPPVATPYPWGAAGPSPCPTRRRPRRPWRAAVSGAFPGIARHVEDLAPAAGRQDDGLGPEKHKPSVLAQVAERPSDLLRVLEQMGQRDLHVHRDPAVHRLVLQCADELEPGAIANVAEPPVGVRTERALQDLPLRGAVKESAPSARARRRGRGPPWRRSPPSGSR
jgi:hypothetical protein